MEKLTAWQSTRDVNYIGSYDLIVDVDAQDKPIYKERIVTIDHINLDEEVMDTQANRKVKKTVAYFKEPNIKPMILNTTNKRGIENATGTMFVERWAGKQILLTVEQIKAFGIMQPALRVKPVPKRLCSVCGKIIPENIYQGSVAKYGTALCSEECKNKLKGGEENVDTK